LVVCFGSVLGTILGESVLGGTTLAVDSVAGSVPGLAAGLRPELAPLMTAIVAIAARIASPVAARTRRVRRDSWTRRGGSGCTADTTPPYGPGCTRAVDVASRGTPFPTTIIGLFCLCRSARFG
jgi:hypothetical protein